MTFQNVLHLQMNTQRRETRNDSWVKGLEMYPCKSCVSQEAGLPGIGLHGRILEKRGNQMCAPGLEEGRGGKMTLLRDGSLAASLHL